MMLFMSWPTRREGKRLVADMWQPKNPELKSVEGSGITRTSMGDKKLFETLLWSKVQVLGETVTEAPV